MSKFEEAARFALNAHAGMMRKRAKTPYILHPFEVATIAASITSNEDVLCASLLHDVVEDTDHTLEEIRAAFGDRVAELVASETEEKYRDLPSSETWKKRKEDSIRVLRECGDRDVHILWLSDKLSNMRSFARLHEKQGDDLWSFFHQKNPSRQAWYYCAVRDAVSDLRETAAWREYDFLVQQVFGGLM